MHGQSTTRREVSISFLLHFAYYLSQFGLVHRLEICRILARCLLVDISQLLVLICELIPRRYHLHVIFINRRLLNDSLDDSGLTLLKGLRRLSVDDEGRLLECGLGPIGALVFLLDFGCELRHELQDVQLIVLWVDFYVRVVVLAGRFLLRNRDD